MTRTCRFRGKSRNAASIRSRGPYVNQTKQRVTTETRVRRLGDVGRADLMETFLRRYETRFTIRSDLAGNFASRYYLSGVSARADNLARYFAARLDLPLNPAGTRRLRRELNLYR